MCSLYILDYATAARRRLGAARPVVVERPRQLALPVLFLLLQVLGPLGLRAQVNLTAVTGTVTDQQGNRVPESKVRATETATGFQRETLTTPDGTYDLPGIPPGIYTVQFFKTGFSAFTAERVEQLVGQNQDAGCPARTGLRKSSNSTRWTPRWAPRSSASRLPICRSTAGTGRR